jgi:hypothetical protein
METVGIGFIGGVVIERVSQHAQVALSVVGDFKSAGIRSTAIDEEVGRPCSSGACVVYQNINVAGSPWESRRSDMAHRFIGRPLAATLLFALAGFASAQTSVVASPSSSASRSVASFARWAMPYRSLRSTPCVVASCAATRSGSLWGVMISGMPAGQHWPMSSRCTLFSASAFRPGVSSVGLNGGAGRGLATFAGDNAPGGSAGSAARRASTADAPSPSTAGGVQVYEPRAAQT